MSAGRVPVSLLAGLGAGERAALVAHWLRTRPAGERWAVLAEGGLALAAAEDGDAVRVQPLGGCPCCSGATVLGVTLVRLLRQRRWDRILVAAGPAAQPAALLRRLREPALAAAAAPAEVVAALDLRQAHRCFDPQAGLREPLPGQVAGANVVLLVGERRAPPGCGEAPGTDGPEDAGRCGAPTSPEAAALAAALRALPGRPAVLACRAGAWPDWDAVRLPAAP